MLGHKYNLRLFLVMVDIENHEDSLKELSKTSVINNLTIMLCWSAPEAAHYLELYKASEHSQPTAIRAQQAQSYKDALVEFVTTPRHINKSDAASLISTFGTLRDAVNAQPEHISAVPGWGERKVRQWSNAVTEDFKMERAKAKSAPQRQKLGAKRANGTNPTNNNEQEPANEEEEAMFLAEALKASRVEQQQGQTTQDQTNNGGEEGLSEGISVALARLRDGT